MREQQRSTRAAEGNTRATDWIEAMTERTIDVIGYCAMLSSADCPCEAATDRHCW